MGWFKKPDVAFASAQEAKLDLIIEQKEKLDKEFHKIRGVSCVDLRNLHGANAIQSFIEALQSKKKV